MGLTLPRHSSGVSGIVTLQRIGIWNFQLFLEKMSIHRSQEVIAKIGSIAKIGLRIGFDWAQSRLIGNRAQSGLVASDREPYQNWVLNRD
jgi:hypothetical protein